MQDDRSATAARGNSVAGHTKDVPKDAACEDGAGEGVGRQPMPLTDDARAFVAMIFDAARSGDAVKLAEFLDQGLPANLTNDSGDSLLMIASYNGRPEVARLLLDRGADPEQMNARGQTPLAGVAFKGDLSVAGLLLDRGADVDGPIAGGKTPLMMAAMFDRLDMVELLLARGADPFARSDDGTSALDAAEATGATRVVERLGKPR